MRIAKPKSEPFSGRASGTTLKAPFSCGYCRDGHHDLCPVKVRGARPITPKDGDMWGCGCETCSDKHNHPFCLLCKRHTETEGEIDPATWSCIDQDGCMAHRTAKREANPVYRLLVETNPRRMKMTETATEAVEPKAPKAPKTGNCLHCGEVTKGGKFLPGHDAAYVSQQVEVALTGDKGLASARAALAETSPALAKKFERSLELGQEKVAKAQKAADAKIEKEQTKEAEKVAAREKKAAADAAKKADAEAKKAEKAAKAEAAKPVEGEAAAETDTADTDPDDF